MTASFRVRMDEEKVRIKITIAGETFLLSVAYSQQETARRTEEEVNQLFDLWRNRFPEKSDRELLAMIAFRYADRRAALLQERDEAIKEASDMTERLEKIVAEGKKEV